MGLFSLPEKSLRRRKFNENADRRDRLPSHRRGVGRHVAPASGGRKPVQPSNPSWMGYSVGRWDGATLVVETSGFTERAWLDYDGHPHTEALRMTERYRRRDFGHLDVKVTFDDPGAYARPWTVSVPMEIIPDTELLEAVCRENEKSLAHIPARTGSQESAAVNVSRALLSKYVGSYEIRAEDEDTSLVVSL